jgi:hypothetical protein
MHCQNPDDDRHGDGQQDARSQRSVETAGARARRVALEHCAQFAHMLSTAKVSRSNDL